MAWTARLWCNIPPGSVNFIKGDFGESFQYERPVKDLLGERLTMTVILALATLIITWVLAIPTRASIRLSAILAGRSDHHDDQFHRNGHPWVSSWR
jgi:hypothetical protein